MILNLYKRIHESDLNLRRGWSGSRTDLMGRDLLNKTVGIVGLGNTGSRVAEICRLAFNCEILAYDPYIENHQFIDKKVTQVGVEELLNKSDVISVHIPLNKETNNMMNKEWFKKMKKGSYFVTTARGSIHNEEDLYEFITNGHLAGAGLDVYEKVPLPENNKLRFLPNTLLLPHIGYVTAENYSIFYTQMIENLEACMNGKPIRVISND
jgi:D-3-phosphoglycerate dehydrogenase